MRASFAVLAAVAGSLAAYAQQPKKVDVKTVQAKLKGLWQERSADPKAAQYDTTWEIFTHAPDRARLTDHDNESVQVDHQVYLNVNADPVWLDIRFRDGAREVVVVGIVKFDGDTIHWSRGKWVDGAAYDKANGLVSGRPQDFSTKEMSNLVLERIKK